MLVAQLVGHGSLDLMHARAEALEAHLLAVVDEAGRRVVPRLGNLAVFFGVD